jgi:hypothetical protein
MARASRVTSRCSSSPIHSTMSGCSVGDHRESVSRGCVQRVAVPRAQRQARVVVAPANPWAGRVVAPVRVHRRESPRGAPRLEPALRQVEIDSHRLAQAVDGQGLLHAEHRRGIPVGELPGHAHPIVVLTDEDRRIATAFGVPAKIAGSESDLGARDLDGRAARFRPGDDLLGCVLSRPCWEPARPRRRLFLGGFRGVGARLNPDDDAADARQDDEHDGAQHDNASFVGLFSQCDTRV